MSYYNAKTIVHLKVQKDDKPATKCGSKSYWGYGLYTTENPEEVTCKRCRGEVKRRSNPSLTEDLTGRLLHSSWGYNMTHNEFYKIVSQTKKQVKAVKIGSEAVEGDRGFSGDEKPNANIVLEGGKEYVFQARHGYQGDPYFVNNKVYGNVFSLSDWNRSYYFNTLD